MITTLRTDMNKRSLPSASNREALEKAQRESETKKLSRDRFLPLRPLRRPPPSAPMSQVLAIKWFNLNGSRKGPTKSETKKFSRGPTHFNFQFEEASNQASEPSFTTAEQNYSQKCSKEQITRRTRIWISSV